MRKHFFGIFILVVVLFLFNPSNVKANFGDLRYEITNVNISGSTITFKGWAYIHRTNNFRTVDSAGLSGGDQKILMQAVVNGNVIDTKVVNGGNEINYNFYCELFLKSGNQQCTESNYKSSSVNSCSNDANGVESGFSPCYYEDIYFKIDFDTSNWSVSESDKIEFKIAASNADYESKVGTSGRYSYGNDYYTSPESVSISGASVSGNGNAYIKIDTSSLSSSVEFIASMGLLSDPISGSHFEYPRLKPGTDELTGAADCTWGSWETGSGTYSACGTNIYQLSNITNYSNGRSTNPCNCPSFLGSDCRGTYDYALKVNTLNTNAGYSCSFACPSYDSNYITVIASGSHVKLTGSNIFKINVKNEKKCKPVSNPSSGKLTCNTSKSFSSTCDELTVKGSTVKIEQKGYISDVITPSNKTFAGGGFSLGITYYNSIKWSYVGNYPGDTVHNTVKSEMNKKILGFEEFKSKINVNNIYFGGKLINDILVKECKTSSSNIDYYNKELVVSCTFYIPESVMENDGDVSYNAGSKGSGISNKYYTPINYSGEYEIKANITGLNRIKSEYARGDSSTKSVMWTGDWDKENSFSCSINLYSLLINTSEGDSTYSFIYRPIEISNPFPNRNAGINWYEWWENKRNQEKFMNTYTNQPQYTVTLNNNNITDIKRYNSTSNYLDWSGIDSRGSSKFIDEKDYIVRMAGDN